MSVVGNSRASQFNSDPFGETETKNKEQEQKTQEPPKEQEQKQDIKQNPPEEKHLTLEDYEKKEMAIRSVALSKDSWAFLKVLCRLEHTSQQDYLNLIIQEKKKSLNLGDDILNKIDEVRKTI